MIDANIRKLGFKTQDIKLIVNSHGHYDHAGGIAALQRASGAMVAASPSGADALRRGENTTDDPQYGFGKAFNGFPPVKNVKVIKDSETLSVGNLVDHRELHAWPYAGQHHVDMEIRARQECLNIVYADSISAVSGRWIQVHRFTRTRERVPPQHQPPRRAALRHRHLDASVGHQSR